MSEIDVSYSDLQRAIADGDSQLPELLLRFLGQDDPEPGAPEIMSAEQLDAKLAARAASRSEADEDDDDDEEYEIYNNWPSPPGDAFTERTLRQTVAKYALRRKTAGERKLIRREAFSKAEQSSYAPPRLRLGDLLLEMYQRGDALGRATLLAAFTRGELGWGIWKAAKGIYKQAEATFDFEMFGALAYRFDAMAALPWKRHEVDQGTAVYLRRRAWRFLRLLGKAVPDAFPAVAVEVLRHYPRDHRTSTWVAGHIWGHKNLRYATSPVSFSAPAKADVCAFPESWKLTPAPLLRLLELSEHDEICKFAIVQLRAHHALALRAVDASWLDRLGRRAVPAVQSFTVALLKDNPDFHQSKLRQLGLHDMVLSLLRSSAEDARAYALEYARTYATDVPAEEWISLVEDGAAAVKELAVAKLEPLAGATITLPGLVRLLVCTASYGLAVRKLKESFTARDLDAELFLRIASGEKRLQELLIELYNTASITIPAGHWKLAVERGLVTRWALQELGKRRADEIGVDWIRSKLEVPELTDAISRWLDAGMLSGPQLDVEWVRSLVARPRLRPLALRLLSNRALIAPSRVGLSWLLELARSADEELAQFGQRFLLGNFAPDDFADEAGAARSGKERLWELLAGASQPEPVRTFAASYLKAHHPSIGPELAEVKSLAISPRLGHDDYALARLRPLLEDGRADVRRFAVTIAKEEMVRWGQIDLLYAMAASTQREPRVAGCDLLLGLGGDEAGAVPASWLDGRRLFALAESAHKGTRETALTLIRRSYERVGGAERLGWLMESAEREVRLFAVRLFWDKHRPRPTPPDWQPPKEIGVTLRPERFQDLAALRQFVRDVLFGLPPGRLEARDAPIEAVKGKPARALPERPLAASVAKARLIDALRALALEDRDFASAVAPVLGEFTHSQAKGERHAAVAALAAIRAAHPELGELGLPKPIQRARSAGSAGAVATASTVGPAGTGGPGATTGGARG
jgi:hypothetical protein